MGGELWGGSHQKHLVIIGMKFRLLLGIMLPPGIAITLLLLSMVFANSNLPSDFIIILLGFYFIGYAIGLIPSIIYSVFMEFLSAKVLQRKYGSYLYIGISVLFGFIYGIVLQKIHESNGLYSDYNYLVIILIVTSLIVGSILFHYAKLKTSNV